MTDDEGDDWQIIGVAKVSDQYYQLAEVYHPRTCFMAFEQPLKLLFLSSRFRPESVNLAWSDKTIRGSHFILQDMSTGVLRIHTQRVEEYMNWQVWTTDDHGHETYFISLLPKECVCLPEPWPIRGGI